ncbi:PP2C family protein-serine/threonine phosphatase [Serinicoccus sediminis]|uniref:PP2C family protein-serine/threonine phosphatase n=1 Tax=Serinicoccus sediminis TaxID=2306021 RepID=UPI001020F813|nr:protein phosphatase 2C domain-containing protein [Serinicoccus sediminis]
MSDPTPGPMPDDPTEPIPAPGTRPGGKPGAGTGGRPQEPAPTTAGDEQPEGPGGQPGPDEVEEEPEPFSDGPPPLPEPMLVLDGALPPADAAPPRPADHGTCASCGGAYDEEGWCTQCGERRPDPRHHVIATPSAAVAGVCDRGRRHRDNEDAMALWADDDEPGRAVLVVCDGVSSAPRSAEASLAAAEAAREQLRGTGDATERHERAARAAADAVAEVAADHPRDSPSCTYVSAVVEGGRASIASIGDSRAYWLPDQGEPQRLTSDDSMAEEQVRAGIPRAEAEAGPLAHTITRWLGPDSPDHRPGTTEHDVSAPGWLLLASDGLWNYASEPADLAAVVRAVAARVGGSPGALAQGLVDWANEQGGADNITVALARCGDERQDGAHG